MKERCIAAKGESRVNRKAQRPNKPFQRFCEGRSPLSPPSQANRPPMYRADIRRRRVLSLGCGSHNLQPYLYTSEDMFRYGVEPESR